MRLLPDAVYDEVFLSGLENPAQGVVVRRNQIEGSITFEAGEGIKQLFESDRSKLMTTDGLTVAEMTRKQLHDRLDAFLNDELAK